MYSWSESRFFRGSGEGCSRTFGGCSRTFGSSRHFDTLTAGRRQRLGGLTLVREGAAYIYGKEIPGLGAICAAEGFRGSYNPSSTLTAA